MTAIKNIIKAIKEYEMSGVVADITKYLDGLLIA